MKPSELQEKTCHQFDCAIKTVIRHRVQIPAHLTTHSAKS